MQEQAVTALRYLAENSDNQVNIVQDGGLPAIIALLRSSDPRVQAQAAGAIRNLAINVENKVRVAQEGKSRPPLAPQPSFSLILFACAGATQPLVSLLCYSNDEVDEQVSYSTPITTTNI
jgi:hypothetical protein